MHIQCAAHAVHSAMSKTFDMMPAEVTSGCVRLFLSVQGSTQLSSLTRRAAQLARARARVEGLRPLSREALGYRRMALAHFLPPGRFTRSHLKVITVAAAVLNGDWARSGVLVHHCGGQGCCKSLQDSQDKIVESMVVLVKLLRPSKLNRSNWLSWSKPFSFMIVQLIHGFLADLCKYAFAQKVLPHACSS